MARPIEGTDTMTSSRAAAIASRACDDRAYRLKRYAAIKKQANDSLAISIKSILDCDESEATKREAIAESTAQYVAYMCKNYTEVARGDGADDEDRDTDVDDLVGDDGGRDGDARQHPDDHLERLADYVSRSHRTSKDGAMRWLTATPQGRQFVATHKGESTTMNSEQRFEKALQDHGVLEICKAAVEQNFVPCSEHELTAALTKHASARFPALSPARAFAKIFEQEIDVRRAVSLAKFPNQMVVTPVATDPAADRRRAGSSPGRTEGGDLDVTSALDQLNTLVEEQRKRAPFKTTAQLFAEVYSMRPDLAAQERRENAPRPGDHPAYPAR
jgi:hypothetical protein